MSTSGKSYKELAIPGFKGAFDCIDQIMHKHQIPYYLIGVNALALELLRKGIKPGRGTKDIDFAMMIPEMAVFETITKDLAEQGFQKVKEPWRFFSARYNVAIDVLPFGQIEEEHTVHFSERKVELHVLGFKEVLEEAIPFPIEEKIVNIPPLPGMVILKLVAWSDRPEQRENDLADILLVIRHYFNLEFDEIVAFHHDTFAEGPFDRIMIAAEVLGRKAKHYLEKSEFLSTRIHNVINSNLIEAAKSDIAREWARKLDRDIDYAMAILEAFRRGINS